MDCDAKVKNSLLYIFYFSMTVPLWAIPTSLIFSCLQISDLGQSLVFHCFVLKFLVKYVIIFADLSQDELLDCQTSIISENTLQLSPNPIVVKQNEGGFQQEYVIFKNFFVIWILWKIDNNKVFCDWKWLSITLHSN